MLSKLSTKRLVQSAFRKFRFLIFPISLIGLAVFPAHANMIANADFSNGLAGWGSQWNYAYYQNGGQLITGSQTPDPFLTVGNKSIAFTYGGPYYGSESIFQTIGTMPGQTYSISFWAQNSGYNTGQSVVFGNLNVNVGNLLGYNGVLQNFVFTTVATSYETTLTFGAGDDLGSISRFGNISVTLVSDTTFTFTLLTAAFGLIILVAQKYAHA